MSTYVLFASELYSLPILRPLAVAAGIAGHRIAWLCSDAIAASLQPGEERVASREALRALAPDAVFSTVHRIPPGLPGRQVQLFHGLNTDKRDGRRGHFRIRGLFDLYCTHGPATTPVFRALAAEHGDFAVVETGWPKLDPLFMPGARAATLRAQAGERPVVMYASTFTESLSSARALLPTLRDLVARGDRHWLLTLHPKCAPELFDGYRALAGPHATFLEAPDLLAMMQAADVLLCDTSSAIDEFTLLDKPVVTLRTRVPRPHMIDVQSPAQVDAAIGEALARPPERMQAVRAHADVVHPYRDGQSSARVVAATERLLAGELGIARARRPAWWRGWKGRALMRTLLPGS